MNEEHRTGRELPLLLERNTGRELPPLLVRNTGREIPPLLVRNTALVRIYLRYCSKEHCTSQEIPPLL